MAEIESKLPVAPGAEGVEGAAADWQQALDYVKENPKTVIGVFLFVVVCVIAGAVYSVNAKVADRKVMTEYAAALDEEDATARMEALQKVAGGNSRWAVEALYLSGEAAIEAKAYDKAREILGKVASEHADSNFAAPASEALAFLDENEGKLEEALAGYTKVFETWDDSFTGRRQPFNMARVQEELGKLPEAIASYKKQIEVFPDSTLSANAEQALARLEAANPDLFPKEEAAPAADAAPAVEVAPAVEAAPAPEAAPAVEVAPAVDAAPAPEAAPAAEAAQ